MSFDINTNIASLQAQQYLRVNSDFQAKTINRVTSGLRIINSGDDAAGLAIANGYRSDQSVLTQGIRNANDGLSTLQTIDGGMNNISMLLDRARTLATQSASGTFNGDRGLLNSEFTSVLSEINRQAQSIGLNTGGTFAKSLSVFIGGGRGVNATDTTSANIIGNGSVAVDLSNSIVDSAGLGLQGVAAVGTASTNLDVTQVLAAANNVATAGNSLFYLAGAGFSGANKVAVSVATAGVQTTSQLVANANAAITSAAAGNSTAAQALKAANVQAYINTDSTGKQQLAFKSANAAFQVQAGDQMANALMGNVTGGVGFVGKDLGQTVAGTGVSGVAAFTSAVIVRIQGGGLASPVDLKIASNGTGAQAGLTSLYNQVAANQALIAAGISVNNVTAGAGTVTFSSKTGEKFDVQVAGDAVNDLKLGTFQAGTITAPASAYDYTSITGVYSATATQAANKLDFSIAGGATQTITFRTDSAIETTATLAAVQINAAIAGNAALVAAGLTASGGAGGITYSTANGTAFRLSVQTDGGQMLGFGAATGAQALNDTVSTQADGTNSVHFDSGGAYTTKAFAFAPIQLGSDVQTLSFSAKDAAGGPHSWQVVLQDNNTARNASTVEQAVDAINAALQNSGDATMKQIVAVKEYDPTTTSDKIAFMSAAGAFQVTVGSTGSTVGVGALADQGKVATAALSTGGSTVAIDQQSNAATAVTSLSAAVAALGAAQAVVGKGQNQFNYAINLAQSQNTNLAAAESRIRDADLAAEAANLTKAQILLQAGTAAVAQANTSAQAVLALLKG